MTDTTYTLTDEQAALRAEISRRKYEAERAEKAATEAA